MVSVLSGGFHFEKLWPYVGAGIGGGLAYAFFGQNVVSLGAGAAAGYFVFPPAQDKLKDSGLPYPHSILTGASAAAIAYKLSNGDPIPTAAAGAAGAFVGYAVLF